MRTSTTPRSETKTGGASRCVIASARWAQPPSAMRQPSAGIAASSADPMSARSAAAVLDALVHELPADEAPEPTDPAAVLPRARRVASACRPKLVKVG